MNEVVKRTVVLETAATMKINVGNFETIDITKKITREVSYESVEDLKKKSANIDSILTELLKKEAETILVSTGRFRVMKIDKVEREAELWEQKVKE